MALAVCPRCRCSWSSTGITVDVMRRTITWRGSDVLVRPQVAIIARKLLERDRAIFTVHELIDALYEDDPSGGAERARQVFQQALLRVRRALKALAFPGHIRMHYRPGGASYELVLDDDN